jgi:hypothetical protein
MILLTEDELETCKYFLTEFCKKYDIFIEYIEDELIYLSESIDKHIINDIGYVIF